MGSRTSRFAKDREIDRSRRLPFPFLVNGERKKKAAAETRKWPEGARAIGLVVVTCPFVSFPRLGGEIRPRQDAAENRDGRTRIVGVAVVAAPRRRITMDDKRIDTRGTDGVRYGLGDVAHARRGTAATSVRLVTCGTTRQSSG